MVKDPIMGRCTRYTWRQYGTYIVDGVRLITVEGEVAMHLKQGLPNHLDNGQVVKSRMDRGVILWHITFGGGKA